MATFDPTRSLTIRKAVYTRIEALWREIKTDIRKTFETNNLGLITQQVALPSEFAGLSNSEKVAAFQRYFDRLTAEKVVSTYKPIPTEILIAARSTTKGVERALRNMDIFDAITLGLAHAYNSGAVSTYLQAKSIFPVLEDSAVAAQTIGGGVSATLGSTVAGVFTNNVHLQRFELMRRKSFDLLLGTRGLASSQVSAALSAGIIRGENPNKIARTMNRRVDSIGLVRSRRIARTEIIRSHNEGAIEEGKLLSELSGETIYYRWSTRLDGRERDAHKRRNGKAFTRKRALALIGEPNCRCGVRPTRLMKGEKASKLQRSLDSNPVR